MFSVTLFRQRPLSRTLPACFTRHAAVWCSDFPPTTPKAFGVISDHLPSERNLPQKPKPESRETRRKPKKHNKQFLHSWLPDFLIQNGDGTLIRNIEIIASAMMSLA